LQWRLRASDASLRMVAAYVTGSVRYLQQALTAAAAVDSCSE
jgi:hypothetical protein